MWKEPILHVDMDAFFVEVERRRAPGLSGRPVVVGGTGPRSVVASASYEARAYGIHSAMPMTRARRLCRDLLVVPPDHAAYQEMSEQVFAIFRSATPLVEGLSLDEAFLDVSGLRRHYPSSVAVGEEVRRTIRTELMLPASVGVAANKMLAKLCSEQAKPDGIFVLRSEEQARFLATLPVSRLFGVGEATQTMLQRLGVETVGDLGNIPDKALSAAVGPSMAAHLRDLAEGRDDRPVVPDRTAKSVSVEETYDTDLMVPDRAATELMVLCDRLSGRLRRAGLVGRTVSLKVRYSDFTTITRSQTLPAATNSGHRLLGEVRSLFAATPEPERPVRLLGVGVSNLAPTEAGGQEAFEDGPESRWDELEKAMQLARSRFGCDAVKPARMSPRQGPE